MASALSCPLSGITSPELLRGALLLWDELRIISGPASTRERWTVDDPTEQRLLDEAAEMVVRPLTPTEADRETALHNAEEIMSRYALEWFAEDPAREARRLDGAPFPDDRPWPDDPWWRQITRAVSHLRREENRHFLLRIPTDQWQQIIASHPLWQIPNPYRTASDEIRFRAGVMYTATALADVCAGTQLRKVTSIRECYRWLAKWDAAMSGADSTASGTAGSAQGNDSVLTLGLRALDVTRIPLASLVEFRRREARDRSNDFAALRTRFVTLVDTYVHKLATEVHNARDYDSIVDDYLQTLKSDLRELRREMNLQTARFFLSAEVVGTVVAAVGTGASVLMHPGSAPATFRTIGTIVTAVGGAKTVSNALDLSAARRKTLREHPTSLLYKVRRTRERAPLVLP